MSVRSRVLFLLAGAALLGLPAGCERKASSNPASRNNSREATRGAALQDKPIAAYQGELLDIAFQTATAIPINPHVKDRSRAQELVVGACLQLDQPLRAVKFAEGIADWRRGSSYAECAFYSAQHGCTDEAHAFLARAAEVAKTTDDWRKDRIRVRMAQTYVVLGQPEQASKLDKNVEASEAGKVLGVKAMLADESSFDDQMKALDQCLSDPNAFDLVRNSLLSAASLFDRFYSDAERRSLVEKRIRSAWDPMPLAVRVDLLMMLTNSALGHADQSKALELVNETQGVIEGAKWPPDYYFPLSARMAGLRYRAGDKIKARTDVGTALRLFPDERSRMADIGRAQAIEPLAEAYQAMGDTAAALAVYKRAVEEGMENPNSRPRAEALCATCRSMALHQVEPDAELWNRIRQINQGLSPPW